MNLRQPFPMSVNAICLFVVVLFWSVIGDAATAQVPPPDVSVLPVFVVLDGQKRPSSTEKRVLLRHLRWAQKRFRELLGNRSTFDFEAKPLVFKSKFTLEEYEKEKTAVHLIGELLDSFKIDRFSCKYVFVAIFMSGDKNYPKTPGGRPINGGFNTGGGIMICSSKRMNSRSFQATLQHELGHAFGLVHPEKYGYDQRENDSIMAYNNAHHTNRFSPSKTPGILIPEDVRGLALNDRVFKNLEFDKKSDVPADYELKKIHYFSPMKLPRHPLVKVETSDGERFGSSVSNIVHSRIIPSVDRGKNEFGKRTMWQSERQKDGIVTVSLTFPVPTALDRIMVYSQHSGKAHGVTGVTVSTVDEGDGKDEGGKGDKVTEVANSEIDAPEWRDKIQRDEIATMDARLRDRRKQNSGLARTAVFQR